MGRKTTEHMDFVRAHKPEYDVWIQMKQRCFNLNAQEYKNYGGRGITVCQEWANSFEVFLQDMGPRPEKGTLDRINNDGNYCPENCRWVSTAVQNRNTRDNRNLTFNGKTQCITDWAAELGIHHQTLRNRLKRGWSDEEALSTKRIEVSRDPSTGQIVGR